MNRNNQLKKAYRVHWVETRSVSQCVSARSPEKAIKKVKRDTYCDYIINAGIPLIVSCERVDIQQVSKG